MPADKSGVYIEMLDDFNNGWIHFNVPGTEHLQGTIDLDTNMKSLVAKFALSASDTRSFREQRSLLSTRTAPLHA